jgi:hypothetical protein
MVVETVTWFAVEFSYATGFALKSIAEISGRVRASD